LEEFQGSTGKKLVIYWKQFGYIFERFPGIYWKEFQGSTGKNSLSTGNSSGTYLKELQVFI
jgi:hypothetical protein